MPNDNGMVHSSKSLNATIDELDRYFDGKDIKRHGELRSKVNNRIADHAEWWFQEGFMIAHRLCLQRLERGEPIETLSFDHNQAWIGPGVERRIEVTSPKRGRPESDWGL